MASDSVIRLEGPERAFNANTPSETPDNTGIIRFHSLIGSIVKSWQQENRTGVNGRV